MAGMEAEVSFVGKRGKNVPEDTMHYPLGNWLRQVVLCPVLPGLCTPLLHLKGVPFEIINTAEATSGYILHISRAGFMQVGALLKAGLLDWTR